MEALNTLTPQMESNLEKLFREGVLIDVDVRKWTGSKILIAEDLGLKPEDVSKVFTLGHVDLVPKKVISVFKYIEGKARTLIDKNSHPFPFGSARFVTKKCFVKVLAELKELKAQYEAEIDSLILNYDTYREEMQASYREAAEKAYINQAPSTVEFGPNDLDAQKESFINDYLARINSYAIPVDQLRSRFSLDWGVYSMALPSMNVGDGNQVVMDETTRQEIAKDCRTKILNFMDDVVTVMRSETVQVCARVRDAIVSGRVINSRTIQSLRDFIERYSDLNFLGDGEIGKQLEDLRKGLLDGHDDLAENEDLKTQLKATLASIVDRAGNFTDINSVTGEFKRRIAWEG
jgi:hypothetical protein